jgi:hypothetical protein
MFAYIFKSNPRILMRFISIDRVIQYEGLYGYNRRNIVEKHFSITSVTLHPCEAGASR